MERTLLQNRRIVQIFCRYFSGRSFPASGLASTSGPPIIIPSRSSGGGHGGGGFDHDWHESHPKGSGTERGVHAPGYDDPTERTNERQSSLYRPGSDTWAYENPWPMLNRGRLDWLFQDGWRRPLAKDQGQFYRREWMPLGWNARDEHQDWWKYHFFHFLTGTLCVVLLSFFGYVVRPDAMKYKTWAIREAYMEIERREAAGLLLVSPDLIDRKKVEASLPSEEELQDFDIIL